MPVRHIEYLNNAKKGGKAARAGKKTKTRAARRYNQDLFYIVVHAYCIVRV
jgi:hypothetical protein